MTQYDEIKESEYLDIDYFGSVGLGSDFTTSTTATWIDTGIFVNYTAPSDGIVIFNSRVAVKFSVAGNATVLMELYNSAVPLNVGSRAKISYANFWHPINLVGITPITEGSHTFKMYVFNSASGTVTVHRQNVTTVQIQGIFLGT